VPDTITIRPEQRDLLAQALSDAVFYRDPPLDCAACGTADPEDETDARLCPDCEATLARANNYLGLANALGLNVDGEA
jgi:hypothetical protein